MTAGRKQSAIFHTAVTIRPIIDVTLSPIELATARASPPISRLIMICPSCHKGPVDNFIIMAEHLDILTISCTMHKEYLVSFQVFRVSPKIAIKS